MTDAYNVLTNAAFKCCELTEREKTTIIKLYTLDGKQQIYDYAKNRKILPFVAMLLAGMGFDTQYWNEIAEEFRVRNEKVIYCLNIAFELLLKSGVKKIFVKENFAALLSADADKALFSSGDVDMYADIAHKEIIYTVFEQLGYTREERFTHKKIISTSFYNDSVLPKGFHFGVSWNPFARLKLPSFLNADDFVDWDRLNTYKDTAIITPDIDALMYICLLHISLHSFSRAPDIRLYIDINNMSMLPVDWEKILNWAYRDKTMVRVLVACFLANRLISVEIPAIVLDLTQSAEYKKQVMKLLKLVYNEKTNTLRYEPRGLKILKIEAWTDSAGFMTGIRKILFPGEKWIREVYVGEKGNIFIGQIKHILNII